MNNSVRCLRCGKIMSEGDDECPYCHHVYESKVSRKSGQTKCENCGAYLRDNDVRCKKCGTFCGRVYKKNNKSYQKESDNTGPIIIAILFIVFVGILFIVPSRMKINIINRIINSNTDNQIVEPVIEEEIRVCMIKCENQPYKIISHKCICSNGNEYDIK